MEIRDLGTIKEHKVSCQVKTKYGMLLEIFQRWRGRVCEILTVSLLGEGKRREWWGRAQCSRAQCHHLLTACPGPLPTCSGPPLP